MKETAVRGRLCCMLGAGLSVLALSTPAASTEALPNPDSYKVSVMKSGFKAPPGMRQAARSGPNFAGHYYIEMTPCGGPCRMHRITDLVNGKDVGLGLGNIDSQLVKPDEEAWPLLCGRADSKLGFSYVLEHTSDETVNYGIWFVVENDTAKPLGKARKISHAELEKIEKMLGGCW